MSRGGFSIWRKMIEIRDDVEQDIGEKSSRALLAFGLIIRQSWELSTIMRS